MVMRNLAPFFAASIAMLPSGATGQIAMAGSPVDEFAREILEIHTRTATCREEFNPREALLKFDYSKGTMQKSEEMDRREPGVTNHVMKWEFQGLSLTSFTHFSFYGPSTWLARMKISNPSELAAGLRFGDSVKQFAQALEVPETSIRSNQVHVDRVDVTFIVDKNDAVISLVFECVAD